MTLVVADTSPINYLVLIGMEKLLGSLFDVVVMPDAVHDELLAPGTPEVVSHWARNLPPWISVLSCRGKPETELDVGEEAAILLAQELNADFLLIDEKQGRVKGTAKGLRVTGTIGLLVKGAERRLINLDECLDRLEKTSAIVSSSLLEHARLTAQRLRNREGASDVP
jgi:predicted nucleic acid-binding protein